MSNPPEFVPHPMADRRRKSITELIRILVSVDHPDVLDEQKLQAIDTLLWKFTEADGKHNTPYRSSAALDMPKDKLRHEHVFTREQLKHLLLASGPDHVDRILRDAVGCLVTIDEHNRLSGIDREVIGWNRYEKAGVPWLDLRDFRAPANRKD